MCVVLTCEKVRNIVTPLNALSLKLVGVLLNDFENRSNLILRVLEETEKKFKRTRKREFLDEMELVVPWRDLVALIEPHSPLKATGRPAFAIETMLRIHLLQQWFNLSDPAMEEALYDTPVFASFARLDPGMTTMPDESTILRFRRLLETHQLGLQILALVNAILTDKNLLLRQGTVVDATLIAAPSSTKNASGERDPQMHQSQLAHGHAQRLAQAARYQH